MNKKTIIICFLFSCHIGITSAQFGRLIKSAKQITDNANSLQDQGSSQGASGDNEKGLSTDVAKSVKTIRFSSTKFSDTQSGESKFIEGDNIFARIELDKPIKSFVDKSLGAIMLGLNYKKDDGNESFVFYLDANNFDQNSKTLDFDVIAASAVASTYYVNITLPSFLKKAMENVAANGKIEFTIELDAYVGSFTLQKKTDASFVKWIDPICEHAKQMMAQKEVERSESKMQKEDKLPEAFHKPSEKFNDPELSVANIRKHLSEEFHVDKIVVGPGADYDVRKDDNGLITSKVTHRYILFSYKDEKTGKCYYNACYFYRDYEGGGKYGDLKYSYDVYPVLLTNCSEVNLK